AATAANQQATIHASAEQFNIDADGTVDLSRPWGTRLTVRANDLDLARLPFDRLPLAGRIRATVTATTDLVQPARGRASANIESITGVWNGQPFDVTSAGELRYEQQRFNVAGLRLNVRGSSLEVKGEWPLATEAASGDLAIEAHADLATLAGLLPADTQVA